MNDEMDLTPEQQKALEEYIEKHGRNWKSKLRLSWEDGNYHGDLNAGLLQQIRNNKGPKWLVKYTPEKK